MKENNAFGIIIASFLGIIKLRKTEKVFSFIRNIFPIQIY